MNVGIFYGTNNGATRTIAELIKAELPAAHGPFNIADTRVGYMQHFQGLLIGAPTYNCGELQDDWDTQWRELDALDLSQCRVAFFGSGDAVGYPDTFQDCMGQLYQKLVVEKGAVHLGWWPTAGYALQSSKAVINGHFCGLAIDENQASKTEARVKEWVGGIRAYFGM